jgi:hypothetical protein
MYSIYSVAESPFQALFCPRRVAMNAPALPEVPMDKQAVDPTVLSSASEQFQRHVWQSAFGPIVIETCDNRVSVNGQRVLSMTELREASPPSG